MQLSGVRDIGSNVLKNTSKPSLWEDVSCHRPVGHRLHEKNSCGRANQTSSPPVNGCHVKIYQRSRWQRIKIFQGLQSKRIWSHQTQSILQKKGNSMCTMHHSNIAYDITCDVVYDIACDIVYNVITDVAVRKNNHACGGDVQGVRDNGPNQKGNITNSTLP
jgi:hypothetical protein